MKYNILSPDGFSIHYEDTYATKEIAFEKFKEWKERYERQGYYSSTKGRISLDSLASYCILVELKRGQNLYKGMMTNLHTEMMLLTAESITKFCKNQKAAETFQNKLYTKYNFVRLVNFPSHLSGIGEYTWSVNDKINK